VSVPAANGGTDCAVGDGESDTEDCNTDDCPCTRPADTARYDLTDAVEVLDRESFDVTGVTCATGYAGPGDAQATPCAESGAAYTLMGCFRLIKLTLGLAIEDIVEDEFKADFQTTIAGLLTRVSGARISVIDISAASIVVSFFIGPPADPNCPPAECASSDEATAELLQLDDAVFADAFGNSTFESLIPVPVQLAAPAVPARGASVADSAKAPEDEGGGHTVAFLLIVMVLLCAGGLAHFARQSSVCAWWWNTKSQTDPPSDAGADGDSTGVIVNPMNAPAGSAGTPIDAYLGKTLWKAIDDPASGKTCKLVVLSRFVALAVSLTSKASVLQITSTGRRRRRAGRGHQTQTSRGRAARKRSRPLRWRRFLWTFNKTSRVCIHSRGDDARSTASMLSLVGSQEGGELIRSVGSDSHMSATVRRQRGSVVDRCSMSTHQ